MKHIRPLKIGPDWCLAWESRTTKRIKPLKMRNGWVLVGGDGRAVERRNLLGEIPMYQSKSLAKQMAGFLNKEREGNG